MFKQQKKSIKFEFPNEKLQDILKASRVWWNKLDPDGTLECSMQKFVKFLHEKKIIEKDNEVKQLLEQTMGIKKVEMNGTIKQTTFSSIINKVFMRSGIINVYYYMRKITERDYNEEDESKCRKGSYLETDVGTDLKNGMLYLLKYQRTILMNGLRGKKKDLGVNPQQIMKTLHEKFTKSKLTK